MRADRDHSGLLVDFGGVLTTSVWDSFADFCREKGLEEDSMRRLFREDPAALAELGSWRPGGSRRRSSSAASPSALGCRRPRT